MRYKKTVYSKLKSQHNIYNKIQPLVNGAYWKWHISYVFRFDLETRLTLRLKSVCTTCFVVSPMACRLSGCRGFLRGVESCSRVVFQLSSIQNYYVTILQFFAARFRKRLNQEMSASSSRGGGQQNSNEGAWTAATRLARSRQLTSDEAGVVEAYLRTGGVSARTRSEQRAADAGGAGLRAQLGVGLTSVAGLPAPPSSRRVRGSASPGPVAGSSSASGCVHPGAPQGGPRALQRQDVVEEGAAAHEDVEQGRAGGGS